MFIIDAHEDIALNALHATQKDLGKRHTLHQGKNFSGFCVNNNSDLLRLREGDVKFVFSTIFSIDEATVEDLIKNPSAPYNFSKLGKIKGGLLGIVEQIAFYSETLSRLHDQVEFVRSRKDYERIKKTPGKIGFILHSEGIDYFTGLDDFEIFYRFGLRSLALTWRNKNIFGSGNNAKGGVTKIGKELLKTAQEKGVIIDLAHANAKTVSVALP